MKSLSFATAAFALATLAERPAQVRHTDTALNTK